VVRELDERLGFGELIEQHQIERQQKLGKEVVFRADAPFAKPESYEALEERGVKYGIRIPYNDSLERDIEELLTRPVGRPSHKPVIWYNLGNLWRRLVLPNEDGQLDAHQLAAKVGKDRQTVGQACPLLLAAPGREPSDSATVWEHGPADRL
jgi:hypothetical protein